MLSGSGDGGTDYFNPGTVVCRGLRRYTSESSPTGLKYPGVSQRRRAQFEKQVRRTLPDGSLFAEFSVLWDPRESDAHGRTQWRLLVHVSGIHIGAMFRQELNDWIRYHLRRTMQRGATNVVCCIYIGAKLHNHLDGFQSIPLLFLCEGFGPPNSCSRHQRGHILAGCHIWIGARCQQGRA